ncbi:MAG: LamG-like jellyroll fold domain-containing protein [Kiloniellaceae bacterium]
MARGFGFTEGAGSGDRVVTSFTAHAPQRSYGIWAYRSSGGSTIGRLFEKRNFGTQVELLHHDSVNEVIVYERDYTIQRGRWVIPINPLGTWTHFGVSYDSSSLSNVADFYVNGALQTAVEYDAPAGSPLSNADAYHVGNRGDGNRNYPGRLAEFAVWNRILAAEEWTAIARGFSPLCFARSLVCHIPLIREATDSVGAAATVVGGSARSHPRLLYPASSIHF